MDCGCNMTEQGSSQAGSNVAKTKRATLTEAVFHQETLTGTMAHSHRCIQLPCFLSLLSRITWASCGLKGRRSKPPGPTWSHRKHCTISTWKRCGTCREKRKFGLKLVKVGCGGGSLYKVLAVQAWRPGFGPQESYQGAGWEVVHTWNACVESETGDSRARGPASLVNSASPKPMRDPGT